MSLLILRSMILILAPAMAWAQSLAQHALAERDFQQHMVLYDGVRGVTCDYFYGDGIPWQRRGGDWYDARGNLFGYAPFAQATMAGQQLLAIDVRSLVREWARIRNGRGAIFLKGLGGGGYAIFSSREGHNVIDWPILEIEYSDGGRELLKPDADATMDCSTYANQGSTDRLMITNSHQVVIQFPISDPERLKNAKRARLVLTTQKTGGSLSIAVFGVAVPSFPKAPLAEGISAKYLSDRGIERDPDVVFASGFDERGEAGGWRSRWFKGSSGEIDIVREVDGFGFNPLWGAALRVNIKKGTNLGADLRLYLKDHGREPDELYFRYYLRFGRDWNPSIASGKLPGMAGTYGEGGWGGRRVDGSNGWSMRGMFYPAFPKGHPLQGMTPIGTYAYHADMGGYYGDNWRWNGAILQNERWYCVEQYVRLNAPGRSDGQFKAWIDGRLVLERNGVRMRNLDRFHIETVWLNVYHGGAELSPLDQHVYFDNVVVAKRYIGPMQGPQLNRPGF